jgi:uncharacterized protein (TIGR01777 family)
MRIFVTGGTGLIGSRLVKHLRERSDEVVTLTRRPAEAKVRMPAGCTIVEGDPTQPGSWMDAIADCDAVIHLAGENIFGGRWNEEFKKKLYDSRVKSTVNVVQALVRKPTTSAGQAKVLINGSAIGYYGDRGDEELTENSSAGSDFLARICIDWEKAAQKAEAAGIRVAMIRTGVVLDSAGGPLVEMMRPFRMFVGGKVGSGQQFISWIHHADIVGIFLLALDNAAARGPINGTAPEPLRNAEFAKLLGKAMHRPSFFPTPKFMLGLALGEVSTLLTSSQRVLPRRAQELNYTMRFPTLEAALADLLGTSAMPESR